MLLIVLLSFFAASPTVIIYIGKFLVSFGRSATFFIWQIVCKKQLCIFWVSLCNIYKFRNIVYLCLFYNQMKWAQHFFVSIFAGSAFIFVDDKFCQSFSDWKYNKLVILNFGISLHIATVCQVYAKIRNVLVSLERWVYATLNLSCFFFEYERK